MNNLTAIGEKWQELDTTANSMRLQILELYSIKDRELTDQEKLVIETYRNTRKEADEYEQKFEQEANRGERERKNAHKIERDLENAISNAVSYPYIYVGNQWDEFEKKKKYLTFINKQLLPLYQNDNLEMNHIWIRLRLVCLNGVDYDWD